MTINPGVGPVRQRSRLSGRQKSASLGVGAALVLGGLMVVHLFSGSGKQEDKAADYAGPPACRSPPRPQPPAPKQVAVSVEATPPPRPRAAGRRRSRTGANR